LKPQNRYQKIIEAIFFAHHTAGTESFEFEREEIERHAAELGIRLPKNIGDIIYTFRYRAPLPPSVVETAPHGKEWVILPAGRSRYRFSLSAALAQVSPNEMLAETKIPDATPGLIGMYALNDEQALLARLRYNRLIDIFSHVTCYSLQNHLRTTVKHVGQVETDEVYVGVDRRGAHYVFPVQAKGGKDRLSVVQVQQDMALCNEKFPHLICRPIGAQFMHQDVIALFEFGQTEGNVCIVTERHYKLVAPDALSGTELAAYRRASINDS